MTTGLVGGVLKSAVDIMLSVYGHDITVYRSTGGEGDDTTFTIRALYVPLTPTFAHDVRMERGINSLENDQSDLTIAGDEDLKEGDRVLIEGVLYTVTTVAPSIVEGVSVCNHALILRTEVPQ